MTTTGWCRGNSADLARRLPNARLKLYPDAGHGGTSLGALAWAATIASADQLRTADGRPRLGWAGDTAQRAVYASAGQLGDIVSGPSNGFCPNVCSPGPGYDYVTGLGSPRTGLDATLAATH